MNRLIAEAIVVVDVLLLFLLAFGGGAQTAEGNYRTHDLLTNLTWL